MSRPSRHHDERGGGTLLVLTVALALFAASLLVVPWAVVSLRSHRVAAAADLAALSAAQAAQSGDRRPCTVARRIAAAQQVELLACGVEAELVTVVVGTRLDLGALGSPVVDAEARAGPVNAAREGPPAADWTDDG